MTTMRTRHDLLAIYLNDHLAGAVAGLGLVRRLANRLSLAEAREALADIADEVAEDRATLGRLMDRLDVRKSWYKPPLAWTVERIGRLKLNGRLRGQSPLSVLIELEAMRLAVEGKAAGWRTLRELSATDSRLDPALLDSLLERAAAQAETLEELRIRAASEALLHAG